MNDFGAGAMGGVSKSVSWSGEQAVAERSPIDATLGSVEAEQSMTWSLLESLDGRLSDVLRPEEAKNSSSGPQPVRMSHSPLHARLITAESSQEVINARLRMLLDRITL